jgi:SAM-dependent methyltransferase
VEIAVEKENQGQAAFTRTVLAFYDLLVLQLTCRLVWRCPNERILATYQEHLTGNHLEVGVGTGYFLDRFQFPTDRPRIGLLDLNANSLERTARRIARYQPEIYQANVLAPIKINARRFDSVGMNYVLHCLPGGLPAKGVSFAHLKALLNPGGVLFGATLLQDGLHRSGAAVSLMRLCNAYQTLDNVGDSKDGLVLALRQHLNDVRVEVAGCVALFSGRA